MNKLLSVVYILVTVTLFAPFIALGWIFHEASAAFTFGTQLGDWINRTCDEALADDTRKDHD